jgi:hypothetical protein
MRSIDVISRKAKKYAVIQNLIDFSAHAIVTCACVIIAFSVALLLMRSPWYALIGIIPLLFYRPRKFLDRSQELEKKSELKGEIVSSLQLSRIPKDNKERYSQELAQAFIDNAAAKIEKLDVVRYIGYTSVTKAVGFLFIAIAFALVQPAFFPARFWYALNHRIGYSVSPGNASHPKDAETDVMLRLWGVYIPQTVKLQLSTTAKTVAHKLQVQNGIAQQSVTVSDHLTYQFAFLEHKTDTYELLPVEPLRIENLMFRLQYPEYTGLGEETRSGRQIVAPTNTVVHMQGRASEPLQEAIFEFGDTTHLECEAQDFRGQFKIRDSGTATLRLSAGGELQEMIRIYAVPDLAPLVDVFYPGANVNLPYDMKLDIGIRCSDDYGLSGGTFCYAFENEATMALTLKKDAFEDTIYLTWDLSELNMLPGDEVSYYVQISDNSGQLTRSNTFYVYFPTMEQMYEEVSEKEIQLQQDMNEARAEHSEHMEEVSRIHEKLMKERELSWADKEQLGELIKKEETILEKVSEWQSELEKTIEKLNEGIILDQKSMERLNEIARIMEDIAPDEFRKALENLRLALDTRPQDIPRTLEQMQKFQEELAKSLERSLEILRRFEQEERLREMAEQADELAELQEEAMELAATDEELTAEKQAAVDQGIEELIQQLNELAGSEGLEFDIQEALEQMSMQMQGLRSSQAKQKKSGLENLAMNLQQLYRKLTQGRYANLRKNLLESLKQLIETSKEQEALALAETVNTDLQQEIIQTTEVIAESLFQQQKKSLFVGPNIGKGLARATLRMKEAQQQSKNARLRKLKAAEAMKELNLVARDIIASIRMMDKEGSSTGMSSFMQQMMNIADGQMMISQSLMNILPIPIQGLGQGQKQQLQRLAARQRELREALESLQGEPAASKFRDLLDEMIKEMEEIEQDLFQYKVSRDLIERQKKVISRLLDSQRSIREEDYAKERKSKPGKNNLERLRPAPLTQEYSKDELREMLQQELRKPYPKEYEIYIREYFKALLEER